MNQSSRSNTIFDTVTQAIVLAYQGVAILVFAASIFAAYAWLKNPFIGGFFEQTLVLNESVTREAGKQWALQASGFRLGDQLISLGGHTISSARDLRQTLEPLKVGQTVDVVMRTSQGETRQAAVTLQSLAVIDQVSYFVIPAFLSLAFLLISLWIFGLRRTEPAGRTFSVLITSLENEVGGLFDIYTYHYFTALWTLAIALAGGALIGLGLIFPQEVRILYRHPSLRWIGFAVGLVLAINAYRVLYDFENPTAYFVAWRIIYIFVSISGLFYFGTLAYRALFSLSPIVKSQARTILIGAVLAFGPLVFWLLYSSWKTTRGEAAPFNPLLFIPLVLFPLANGYVILRFRLLRTDYWLRQGIVYSLLTIFVIAAYGLLVSGIGLITSNVVGANNPYLIGGLVFLIAVLLEPLRTRLQVLVDSTFFRGRRAYEERLRVFSHDLTNAPDLATIGRVLRGQINSSLVPERLHIYTYDSLNEVRGAA